MIGPCINCEDRILNCHSDCRDYKEYRNKLNKINQIKKEEAEFYRYSFDRKLVMGVSRDI